MTLARKAGYVVPDDAYNKALGYLRNQVAATDNADYESKAMLLHALAGRTRKRTRRFRPGQPAVSRSQRPFSAALAHLALGFAAMDRKASGRGDSGPPGEAEP